MTVEIQLTNLQDADAKLSHHLATTTSWVNVGVPSYPRGLRRPLRGYVRRAMRYVNGLELEGVASTGRWDPRLTVNRNFRLVDSVMNLDSDPLSALGKMLWPGQVSQIASSGMHPEDW